MRRQTVFCYDGGRQETHKGWFSGPVRPFLNFCTVSKSYWTNVGILNPVKRTKLWSNMNSSKGTHDLSSTCAYGGEGSDQSMSDSWTVLDSSHFKDDGDLSDAESVEVLATDEPLIDNASSERKFYETLSTGILSISSIDESESTLRKPNAVENDTTLEEEHIIYEDTHTFDAEETDASHLGTEMPTNKTNPSRKHFFFNGAPFEIIGESFSTILLELAIYSLIIDLFILTYFGFSSMAGIFEKPGSSLVKMSPPHLQYEVDPLALQLSHVLAEWKKQPLENHSLDRHVLKTLLLHYGGSTELSATLHSLTAKIQKNNEFIRQEGEDWNMDKRNHFIVSGHLAHSVACILGKQDSDKSLPADLFTSVNNRSAKANSDFLPEPTFWLNDWHLPQYFKANDTYYRVDNTPVLPSMRNLFLNLGSAKWNQYFWKLYHEDIKVKKTIENKSQVDRTTENEVEAEETERSPLDLIPTGDMITAEESSGNVQSSNYNFEDIEVHPHFLVEEDADEAADVIEEKGQMGGWDGNYFEVLDGEEYLGSNGPYQTRYVCLDDSCRPFKAGKTDEGQKEESTGKLSRLFEEYTSDDQKSDQITEWSYFMDEDPAPNEWNTFREPHSQLNAELGQNQKKSKLIKLFEESDEFQGKNTLADLYVESPQTINLFDDIVQNDGVLENRAYEKPKMGKLAMLFEELGLEDTIEQKKENVMNAEYPTKEQKSKLKRKSKGNKHDTENSKQKGKQKRKSKGIRGSENKNSLGKKKMKKRHGLKKVEEFELPNNYVPFEFNDKNDVSDKNAFEGKISDWNTRMAQGREKLRALSEKEDDKIWWLERTRARRAMREEAFSE